MTDRVRAGCEAAVQLAVESAEDPGTLAATVDLGKLEGMWALLFQRRQQLQAKHAATITKAWRPLVDEQHITAAVQQFRSRLGLAEADGAEIRTEAVAAASAMLSGISEHPGFGDLRTALLQAIAAGRAEGMVNAVAIAAEQAHHDGLDWDTGFAGAYADVLRLQDLTADTTAWLGRLVERAIISLARLLASSTNTSADETTSTLTDAATGKRIPFVEYVVDWAMTESAGQGVLDLLRSEGVAYANWVTVGDRIVCAACKLHEDLNPWSLADFPVFPEHPFCRCMPEAAFPLRRYDAWFA